MNMKEKSGCSVTNNFMYLQFIFTLLTTKVTLHIFIDQKKKLSVT